MNWQQLAEDYNIDYVTRSSNTKKGEISVKCPWCGEDDPSYHMGINLSAPLWGCYRNQAHRGKAPYRLIQGLLGCSYGQAKLIVAQYDASDPETLEQALQALEPKISETKIIQELKFPSEFKLITKNGAGNRFYQYLLRRGFDMPRIVSSLYNLKCCTTGKWKDRIIIPIYLKDKLIGWTGRAIQQPIEAPRYLSTSDVIKTTIYNEDYITAGGHLLFVTEGPFDAIKLDYYGLANTKRIKTTCTFGTSLTNDQLSILRVASKRYKKVVILFDKDATGPAFELTDWLSNSMQGVLPMGIKDPGEMTQHQVSNLIKEYM